MLRVQFLEMLDDLFERPHGTIKGSESLESLDWDSLKVLEFIVLADEKLEIDGLSANKLAQCVTVEDLLGLVAEKIQND